MGDCMKPKEILDSNGTNVRFDFALRLANEFEIDVNEICSASPFSGAITEEEIYPLPNRLNGALDGNRVKTYLKNSMYPLMYLFGKNSMPDVDNLLTFFYQLDDEARKEVLETIQFKLQYHRDPERAEQIKQIKGL
ncbi:MAG: XRE family transcriptional regulator [Butyrivibrio crossotus]|nr:XRE family transcriptional regulator [Butyrivibrio crossotus]